MRGIVTTAGGRLYFPNAYAGIRLLRYLGCTLPVEWFYLGPHDMPPKWIELAEEIEGVTCRDLGGENIVNRKDKGGWQSKIESILHATADEVLFMDADNFVTRDPTYLFDHPLYQEHGAVLWKDIWPWEPRRFPALEREFGVAPQHESQVESGQLLFDKTRCLEALGRVQYYNHHWERFYQIVYGDKDTFYFGFLTTNTPFNFTPRGPTGIAGGLAQYDFDGNHLFSHMTGCKLPMNGRFRTSEDALPYIEKLREFLFGLRDRLATYYKSMPRP